MENTYRCTHDFVLVRNAKQTQSIKNFHRQNIQKALEAMAYQAPEQSSFKTTCLAISQQDFSAICDEVSRFCHELMVKYGKRRGSPDPADRVYTFTSQLIQTARADHEKNSA